MASNDAEWRGGPFKLSANKDTAIAGLKITKGVELRPWRTTVNFGAFIDMRGKEVRGFSRVEVDAGKAGTVVADIEGLELQKEWTLPFGVAESQLSLAAGVGITTGRPYVNVDIRPSKRPAKAVMLLSSLYKGEGVDMRPSITISRNASVELPVTLSAVRKRETNAETGEVEEMIDCLKLHAHGAIACVKFPNHVVKGDEDDADADASALEADIEGAKKAVKGAAAKGAKDVKAAAAKGEEKAKGVFGKAEKQAKKTKAELEAEAKKAKEAAKKTAQKTKAEIEAEAKKSGANKGGWGIKKA